LEFTSEKKRLFLDALARTECIRAAAKEAGVMPGSVAYARGQDRAFGEELNAAMAAIREGRALVRGLGTRPEARPDGFTAKKRRRFMRTLAKTGCIADAARTAAISTTTVTRWRRKDADFAGQCRAAIHKASGHIETLAWERGVTGIPEDVYAYGKYSHTRIKRSDAIFRMLLMASNGRKYGRMGAVGRKQIEAELRARVEAEVRQKLLPRVASNAQVREALTKALAAYRDRVALDGGGEPEESGA